MEPSCAPSPSSSASLACAATSAAERAAAPSAPRRGPKPGAPREAGTRWVLEPDDIMLLERVFQLEACPGKELKHQLATHLNVRPRQVQVWFQNKRQRSKLGAKALTTERQPRAAAAAAAAALVARDTQAAQSAALLLSLVQDRRAPASSSEPPSGAACSGESIPSPSAGGPSAGPSAAAGSLHGVSAGGDAFGDCHGMCCLAAASQSLEVVAAAPPGAKPEPEPPRPMLSVSGKASYAAAPLAPVSQPTSLQPLTVSPGGHGFRDGVPEGAQPSPAATAAGLQEPSAMQPPPSGLQCVLDAAAVKSPGRAPQPQPQSQQPPDGFTDGAVLWMRSDMLGRYPSILTHGHAPVYVSPGHSAAMLPGTEPAQEPPEPRAGNSGSS